jgi:hypothetical protein
MNFKSIKNGFKMTTVALTIMSIVGCAGKPQIVVYDKKMNDKKEEVVNLTDVNKNGDNFEYRKNSKNEIVMIKKVSAFYNQEDCKTNAETDYKETVKTVLKESKLQDIYNSESLSYTETVDFKITKTGCQINKEMLDKTSTIEEKEQKIYNYEIKVENFDKSSGKPSTMSKIGRALGMTIAFPFIIVGFIILFPVYLIKSLF